MSRRYVLHESALVPGSNVYESSARADHDERYVARLHVLRTVCELTPLMPNEEDDAKSI